MDFNMNRAFIAILFALLFITIGWVAPVTYAAYAPQDHFIEQNEFVAEDATTEDSSHMVCFDRNVKQPTSSELFIELYLVNGETGNQIEVDSRTRDRYFQEGQTVVETDFTLPDHIEAGTYQYMVVAKVELAQGRAQREFIFESEKFNITEGEPSNTTTADFSC